jgi:O-antigen/teichoic acid export membrane protein
VLHLLRVSSSAGCLLAFGGTATLAAVLGCLQGGVLPRPGRITNWLRTHYSLSFRYLAENLSLSGASLLRSFIVGIVVSLSAVGEVRASEILMGPFMVLLMGVSQVAVPEASLVLLRDAKQLVRFCFRLGSFLGAAAIAWGVILLTVFPLGPGRVVLKELWTPTAHLIPAITLTVAITSFITAANAGLRATGVARRSLRAQLTASVLYLFGGSVGAILGGALGTSWGVTAAQCAGAMVCWHQLRLAISEHSQSVVAK